VRSVDGLYAGSGPEMTLLRGEQRAIIKAPRFVLPSINDLGPGKKKPQTGAPGSPVATPASPTGTASETPGPITVPIAPTTVPPK
jgi:hypothetical protein